MEQGTLGVRQVGMLLGTATAIWVASFPFISIGPLSSALLSAAALAGVVVAGTAAQIPNMGGWAHQHRPALVVLLSGGLAAIGLLLSAALNAEVTYHDDRGLPLVRLLTLFGLSYVATLAVQSSLHERGRAAMARLGAFVTLAILAVIGGLFIRSGINPIDSYSQALRDGSFGDVYRTIRIIHSDLGGIESSNVRHIEIRGALCASFLALSFAPGVRSSASRWAIAGVALASLFAVLQFSRANMLIVAATATVAVWPFVRSAGRRVGLAVGGLVGLAVVAVLQLDLVADALSDGSNNSSEVRSSALSDGFGLIDDALPLGLDSVIVDGVAVTSPHNTLLDLTLGAGVLGTVGALGLVAVCCVSVISATRAAVTAPSINAALPSIGLAGLLLIVFFRLMTGGGGLLDPVSWIAFGAALALQATAVEPSR